MSSSTMRPFSASLPMALLESREVAMRLFRPMLAEHDLTEQQWRVLRALESVGQPIDAGALAARTHLLAPSVSRILTNLGERGLIDRAVDPADQRRTLLSLSEAGRAQVATVAPESEKRYAAIETAFGRDRLTSLLDELHAFAQIVEPECGRW